MGVFTYEDEIVTAIPPAKMFQKLVIEGDQLIPKIVPNTVKSVEFLEGDGGPGSIKKITFGEGHQFNYIKHKIEKVDKDNLTYCYSVIEGDALMKTLEKIEYETVLTPSPDGGSVCKNTSKYYTIGDIELKEEEIKAGKERVMGLFKLLETYLLANPDHA